MKNKNDKEEVHEAEVVELFEQAAKESMDNDIEISLEVVKQKMTVGKKKKEESLNFKQLEKKIDNEYAAKFNQILETLPDREFVRVYLKVLEYFKPKIVRGKSDGEEDKTPTINVIIRR